MTRAHRLALSALLVAAAPARAAGADLPSRLACDLSGRGSCSEGVCVGGGVRDPAITLTIAPGRRSVAIDRLTGQLAGDAPLALAEPRDIAWAHGLIRYTRLTLRRHPAAKGRVAPFVAYLGDGERHLEFQCRPA